MKQSGKIFIAVLLTLVWLIPAPVTAGDTTARKAVEQLLEAIGKIDDGDNLTAEQIEANRRYTDRALQLLNLKEISQKALGKFWKDRTKKEQEEFTQLLSQLFFYVAFPNSGKFFSGLKVVYKDTTKNKSKAIVPCTVIHKDEGEIDIDFHLQKNSKQWRVTDVYLDEVSMRNNLRSQFYRVIKKKDFKELARRMETKLEEAKN